MNNNRVVFSRAAAAGALGAAAVCLQLLAGPGARAQDAQASPWYFGASIPLMFVDDTESTSVTDARFGPVSSRFRASTTTEHDTGFKVAGIVGYELGNGLRIEGEVYFSRANVDKLTYTGINVVQPQPASLPGELPIPVSGSASQLGGNLNAWFDLDIGTNPRWRPYVGAGVGFMHVDQGDVEYDDNALAVHVGRALTFDPSFRLPPGAIPEISSTDTVLAFHFGAGIGYALSENATIQVGYRLQSAQDLEFTGSNPAASVAATSGMRVHFLELGVRYRF